MIKQEPPFAIQIEPTEGCTLACSFCALQSIRSNGADAAAGVHGKRSAPYKFMEFHTATRIAREIARLDWNPRIEFAMHGEPTVHPGLRLILSTFRVRLPQHYLMVTSNGSGLMKDYQLENLFDAGADTIALDNYKHADFVPRIREWLPQWLFNHPEVKLFYYPRMAGGNPHKRTKGKRLVIIDDISDNASGTHVLTNQGGNSFPGETETLKQRCAKPFRELSIRWDGNVALCCDDWPGVYKIGNVKDMPLDELWNHERFQVARRALYHGQRQLLTPCSGCNVRTYRNGLLPDKMGKQTLKKVSYDELEIVADAEDGAPYTEKI